MKKVKIIICLMLLFTFIGGISYAETEDEIGIIVDTETINSDVPPIIIEGRTMVPLRAIGEYLGVNIKWDSNSNVITANTQTINMVLPLNSKVANVNGEEMFLDAPATIIKGRTLVPTRFIAETLGAEVTWDEDSRTVIINTKKTNVNTNDKDDIDYDLYSDYDHDPSEISYGTLWIESNIGTHHYKGQFQYGQPHGYGTLNYADGRKYVGDFRNGVCDGVGTLDYIGGERYSGDFKNGAMDGQGTYNWREEAAYVGEFKNNKMDGYGTLVTPDGKIYEGEFKNNLKSGQGKTTWDSGDQHIGQYENDKKNGYGTYFWTDGSSLSGYFIDGIPQFIPMN